jgi:dTDP-4-amino-4,6-dideoxygalactose transaminase
MASHPLPGWSMFGGPSTASPSVLETGDFLLTRSARSALALALETEGIGSRDRVLLPNYYCPTMPAPIESVGASPLFYPIRGDGSPDVDWLRAHFASDWKAVVGVHFFGLPTTLKCLRELCEERGLILVEDCAHAFFGRGDDLPVGSSGHYVIASLPKFFPVLEGGVLASRTRDLRRRKLPHGGLGAEGKAVWNLMEIAAAHRRLGGLNTIVGAISAARQRKAPQDEGAAYQEAEADDQVRRDALADPLLRPMSLRRVERLVVERVGRERIVSQRRRNYSKLAELFRDLRGLSPVFPQLPQGAVPYAFPIRCSEPAIVFKYLRERRLPVLRWNRYWPGAIDASSDVGRDWAHHVIQILCHQDLTEVDMQTISAHAVDAASQSTARPVT